MDGDTRTDRPKSRRAAGMIGLAALAGIAAGIGAIYALGTPSGNVESAACPGAGARAARLSPLAKGEIAAVNVATAPAPLPALRFARPDGSPVVAADLKGRSILLNLWATWCVPCRTEMPALDRLQASLGGPRFEVVSVNIDQRNPQRAEAFLDEIGVKSLARYADPSAGIFQALKSAGLAFGMPTTLLIDAEGCVLASLAGPADWASEDAKAFVAAAAKP
jgi:thiol-disulfide isomerase/thioredoxin